MNVQSVIQNVTAWYMRDKDKVFVVIALNTAVFFLSTLPYVNVLFTTASFLPYVLLVLSVWVILRPRKTTMLLTGLSMFILAIPAAALRLNQQLEVLGNTGYVFLFSYVLITISSRKGTGGD